MDKGALLASKLSRRMAEPPSYSTDFDLGRIIADTGRVLARVWLPISVGVLVVGAVPTFVSSIVWWHGSRGTTQDEFRHVWVAINLAKLVIKLAAQAAVAVFVTGVSLHVLSGLRWRTMLTPRCLTLSFVTAVCVAVIGNWPSLVSPLVLVYVPSAGTRGTLSLLSLLSFLLTSPLIGVAVSAAVAEQMSVGPALTRSFRLLRSLRWRAASLCLAYLMVLGLSGYGIARALVAAQIDYRSFGLGFAALSAAPLPAAVLFEVGFVSFFLQARRIADGPPSEELHEVFA